MESLQGTGVSRGIVIGTAFLYGHEDYHVPKRKLAPEQVQENVARFEDAILQVRDEITELKDKLLEEMGEDHARILQAHLHVLEDDLLKGGTVRRVRDELVSIEYALSQAVREIEASFSRVEDAYLRERVGDIRDVSHRILRKLLGREKETLSRLHEDVIVVAHDISPSDMASMDRQHALGIATDVGGPTSHTAILARALEVPAVVGLGRISEIVKTGDTIIIDGNHGIVKINPDAEELGRYEKAKSEFESFILDLLEAKDLPAETLDGHRIALAANIELPDELIHAIENGAEGVGLFRTEFLYLGRSHLPSEDEQFEVYKRAAEAMAPHAVVMRTLDLGGDKRMPQLETAREGNPTMGLRSLRLCFAHPHVFNVQLRAILRASAFGKVKIMYPMISGFDELRRGNEFLERCKIQLEREGVPFDHEIEVGAMIEVPSAALIIDILARDLDFVSIGTNDLIQYSLAVDRTNERVSYLYEPSHPAVIRLIASIIENAIANDLDVAMCGEMASEPGFAIMLLGMGINSLSVAPFLIPEIRKVIRSITLADARALADTIKPLQTGLDIHHEIESTMERLVPDLGKFVG